MKRTFLAAMATFALMGSVARAQEIVVDGAMIEEPDLPLRLGAWLEFEAEEERGSVWQRGLGIGLSYAFAASGVATWLSIDSDRTINWSVLAPSTFLFAVGTFALADLLINGWNARHRYEEFLRLRASNEWSDSMRARLEGEWRAEARHARQSRYVSLIAGFTMCAVGGAMIGAAYALPSGDGRVAMNSLGTLSAGFGCGFGISGLFKRTIESDVEAYDLGMRPMHENEPRVSISPIFGNGQVGGAFTGTF